MTKAILRQEALDAYSNISSVTITSRSGAGIYSTVERTFSLPDRCSIFKDVSYPHYATFENIGIDLKNDELVGASQYSNLPLQCDEASYATISTMYTEPVRHGDIIIIENKFDSCAGWGRSVSTGYGYEIPLEIEIAFTTLQDISNGIQIKFSKYSTFHINEYLERSRPRIDADVYLDGQLCSFTKSINGNVFLIDTSEAPETRKITLKFRAYMEYMNSLLIIDNIIFGREVEFDDIIGQANCFSEVKPTLDDAPAGSCDLTVVSSSIPEEGQTFRIESDNFKGKYTIEEVTRQADDIFVIKGYDDIQELDATAYVDATAITSAEQITSGTAVSWIDTPTASVSGSVKEGTTRRQALAMYSIASGKAMTSFNETDGIYPITLGYNASPDITSDEILGKAEYKAQPSYSAVVLKYENSEGEEEFVSLDLATKGNRTKGNYEIDMTTLFGTNKTTMLNNIKDFINGAEIEATIVYSGQKLGDLVNIETPYNGTITGIIKSIELALGSRSSTANIVVKEVTE